MNLALDKIRTDAGTQARAVISSETVDDYAEAMTEGAKFPPVIVYHDGTDYFLADGFHRVMAAARLGFKDIASEVRKGTREDALWFALGANRTNGQRMNRADVRHAIAAALVAFPKRSNREIAAQIGCNHETVQAERAASEQRGDIRHVTHREDSLGRMQPAHREPPAAGEPPEPEEPEPPAPSAVEIDAVMIADKAIFYMTQIGPRMKRRDEAMEKVVAWCKARQREWRRKA